MNAGEIISEPPQISIIVPARNEEASLGSCLESLVTQIGVSFEIIVVNDHSTDRTGEIAVSFPHVRVMDAGPLPPGWTGKNNAVATGARAARGEWLLFTDADTVHLPNSLAHSLAEAKENAADLLSYSPEQIAVTFWERATLPVVFAELAREYPPSKVSDPNSPAAAANGQYILVKREAYEAVGGHAGVASNILEDVSLARAVKASGRKIRFRYAADAVRTRMYRDFGQLREGWTKNLALLFPAPGWLAAKSLLLWAIPWAALILSSKHWWWSVIFLFGFFWLYARLHRANFRTGMTVLAALFGVPMFAYLLLRSKRMHGEGSVSWKGRIYQGREHANSETDPGSEVRHKTLMKMPLLLILFILLMLSAPSPAAPPAKPIHALQNSAAPHFANTLIEAGLRMGPLKLGDTRDRALELFPRKAEDQEWEDPCGTTLDWVDTTNPVGRGDVFIRLKKGKIFQIESSTTRFATAEGITTFDSPDKVASSYKELRAGVLLTAPNPALGDRPLVFWFDKKRGIAFTLAYDPSRRKRYVYKITVFEPNKNFCPEQETINSTKWQNIDSYRVEPPRELSPEP
jgi:glycosyltransferase involved in cell wall biosynthesis